MSDWSSVKSVLVIRPDNMGDLVMSGPALRSLKQGLNARITVLTSSMAAAVAKFMPEIDEVITFDVPWVKSNQTAGLAALNNLIVLLRDRQFDAAVIFTVYSQNPLPSAMIAYLAGIPRVLAYCRENPYQLISDWVVDKEPFEYISHQVDRDLRLVSEVCPIIPDVKLNLQVDESLWSSIAQKLNYTGINLDQPWLILHPCVSEIKRQLPEYIWIEVAKQLTTQGYQIVLTGAPGEKDLTQAVGTPVVVLYAQTNPQHTPWMVPNMVIEFPVPAELKSKNEIIRQVDQIVYKQPASLPDASLIVNAVLNLLKPPFESDRPSPKIHRENRAI
jgi:ADP-heptose:LPS heptosyltransferase